MDVLYINLYSWPILAADDPGIGLDSSWALYSTGHIRPIGEQEPDDTPADFAPNEQGCSACAYYTHKLQKTLSPSNKRHVLSLSATPKYAPINKIQNAAKHTIILDDGMN